MLVAMAALVAGGVSVIANAPVPLRASSLALAVFTGAVRFVLDRVNVPLGDVFGSRRLLDRETALRCPVADATDPLRLGVHPAVDSPGEHGRRKTPRYVPRDIDHDLDEALGGERLVLLLGDATAGKSRAAYEALHRMPSGRWVLVPRDAGSLRRLGDGGIQLRDTVLWLDDLDRYLGVDGLDLALLERLIGEPGLARRRPGEYADRCLHGTRSWGRRRLRSSR